MNVIALVFLLLALLIVIGTLFPDWSFATAPTVTPNRLVGLIIALIVLFVIYLIVVALFGTAFVATH